VRLDTGRLEWKQQGRDGIEDVERVEEV